MATTELMDVEAPVAAQTTLMGYVPAEATPRDEIVAALRTVTPLIGLSDEHYQWLAEHGTERMGESGALIFREGETANHMSCLLKGEIHVRRRHGGPMAFFIGRAGQITGKLPYSRMKAWGGDGYTNGPVWVLQIHEDLFPEMLRAIPPMGQICVSALLDRVREVTRMEQQAEKLAALGKLAANLAHELNNPASAAQRSAASLFTELKAYGDRKYRLGTMCLSPESSGKLQRWMAAQRDEMCAYKPSAATEDLGPLAAADREAEVLGWLESHNVPDAWAIASALSETGLPLSSLDQFAAEFPAEVVGAAMGTFATALRVERMAETVVGSTVRIFDLISAIKDYSYMDQAPIQNVDLAQSLEITLSMFASRLMKITLETEFAKDVPVISAYGSELNQVWTALIENALDAMPDGGTLHLKTKLAGLMVVVEIWDTGAGVPEDLKSRIFEPFFTTKAPGSGLGLGLDTAQRIVSKHSGFLTVESKPGETCFQVRLPLDQAQAY
jgi:signal transduction histidine kinase